MRRFTLPGLVATAGAALVALLVFGIASQGASNSLEAGIANGHPKPAPAANVALPVLGSSQTRSLKSFRGKLVVVNVFASWCDPCKAEASILVRAERQLVAHNGTVVGITYQDNTSDAEAFVHEHQVNYPVLRDVSGNFTRAFGATWVPQTFVINRQGSVVALCRYQLVNTWLQDTLSKRLSNALGTHESGPQASHRSRVDNGPC